MTAQSTMPDIRHLIDGEWEAGNGARLDDVDPARPRRPIATGQLAGGDQIERVLAAADRGHREWRETTPGVRAAVLTRAAAALEGDVDAFAHLLAIEQGKPLLAAGQELTRSVEMLRYAAQLAYRPVGTVLPASRPGERIMTIRKPIGPTLVITPWNVPVLIPIWKIGPALMAGNAVIWKPSEHTPLIARRLAEILAGAGLPAGVLQTVTCSPADSARLLDDPRTRAASFTGSTPVGRRLIEAGTRTGTRVLAEMGGNNAAIVMGDADLATVVPQLVNGAMRWSGQRCTATSRILVHRESYQPLIEALTAQVRELIVGDPLAPDTELGPLTTQVQFDAMLGWFARAAESATLVAGGSPVRTDESGWYVQPTVVTGVGPAHPLFREEAFGPLAVVVAFDTIDEAFALANTGDYGLSGAVFTRDLGSCLQAIDRLQVGVLHINSETTGTEPHAPFGGLGDSGTPDKEMGEHAIDFFREESTVYVRGL